MSFYEDPKNVDDYIKMCEEYDGSNLYALLQQYLPEGKTLLELGSGPGFDMPFLIDHYQVTGSDYSREFLTRCKQKFPSTPFLTIDAKDIKVATAFDCIYSNKVLHHLTEPELTQSLSAQKNALTPAGLIAHSFWIGNENKEMEGLLLTYYRKEHLLSLLREDFEILTSLSYQEFETGDSLFVIARCKNNTYT